MATTTLFSVAHENRPIDSQTSKTYMNTRLIYYKLTKSRWPPQRRFWSDMKTGNASKLADLQNLHIQVFKALLWIKTN